MMPPGGHFFGLMTHLDGLNPFYLLRLCLHGLVQIPTMLQQQPKIGAVSEILRQTECRAGCYPTPAVHQFVYALIWNMDSVSEVALGNSQGLEEFLHQHFPRVGWLSVCWYANHWEAFLIQW